jgi:hypothetical protein
MIKESRDTAQQLERLAAWHRIQADHADAPWIWEARVLAAEALERRAAEFRCRPMPNARRNGARTIVAAAPIALRARNPVL